MLFGPQIWVSGMHNACASVATGKILMWATDDISFVTYGWDAGAISQFEKWNDVFGLVFLNDLSNYKGKLTTHSFVKR